MEPDFSFHDDFHDSQLLTFRTKVDEWIGLSTLPETRLIVGLLHERKNTSLGLKWQI